MASSNLTFQLSADGNLAGLDLQGHAVLDLTRAYQNGTTHLTPTAPRVTGGMAPVPALIGDEARLSVSAAATGSDVTVSRFEIDGRKIKSQLRAPWRQEPGIRLAARSPDLRSALPTMAGALQLHGRVTGPPTILPRRRAFGNAWAGRQAGGTDQRERAIARPPRQACWLGYSAGRVGRIPARAGGCGNPRR